jgi:transcriptional regulator GlxA family with amidase domain
MAGTTVFDSGLSAILDVLDTANTLRTQIDQPPQGWTVTTVGPKPHITTGAGHLVPARPLSEAKTADLLIIPALAKCDADTLIRHVTGDELAPVREQIALAAEAGIPIYSACTGTFLLAETGILDGRRATTTWWLSPLFRHRYPAVDLDLGQMVVADDGVTTAGAAFGHVDLALALVRTTSPTLADLAADYLVIDERPSQAAYAITSALAHSDPTLTAFERWTRTHLNEPITVSQAAAALNMSERALQRKVHRTLGITPLRFIQDIRVERAAHLIKTTDLSLDTIARKVGYEHAASLRTLLRQRTGHTTKTLRDGIVLRELQADSR